MKLEIIVFDEISTTNKYVFNISVKSWSLSMTKDFVARQAVSTPRSKQKDGYKPLVRVVDSQKVTETLTIKGYITDSTLQGYTATSAFNNFKDIMKNYLYGNTAVGLTLSDDSGNVKIFDYYLSRGSDMVSNGSNVVTSTSGNFIRNRVRNGSLIRVEGPTWGYNYYITSVDSSTQLTLTGSIPSGSNLTYYCAPCAYIQDLKSESLSDLDSDGLQSQYYVEFKVLKAVHR